MCDVRRLGGELAERLALISSNTDQFRFDASSVPALPRSATSDSAVIKRRHHDYNGCWRADALHLYATRQTLRAFGVIVFASLFAPPGSVTDIGLTHPATDICTLRLKTPSDTHAFARGPLWYDYWPEERHKFPWDDECVAPSDLPAVYLTDPEEVGGVNDAQWLDRNIVVGFGTQEGMARFGQFLLDVGNPAATRDEYHLEGEAGNRGVAPLSAELSLWLPGSFGWEPSHGLA